MTEAQHREIMALLTDIRERVQAMEARMLEKADLHPSGLRERPAEDEAEGWR